MAFEHMDRLGSNTESSLDQGLLSRAALILVTTACLSGFRIHILELDQFSEMNVSEIVGCDEGLLLFADKDVGDEVLSDR
jgi:hypothetical protein